MKIPFLSKTEEPTPPEPVETKYTMEFRDFVDRYVSNDIQGKFYRARPFIFASFIAWPTFWLFKGLEWGRKRHAEKLAHYINRTYLQAKIMQICIIAAGIIAAKYDTPSDLENVSHKHDDYRDV